MLRAAGWSRTESTELVREAASYVDRILRGANPAELPVQLPTKYQLVINMRVAKVGEYKGDPLYHASLSPDEYDALIARFEFRVLEHRTNDAQAGGRTVWLCQSNKLG
jgi:hypothetical protein